MEKIIRLIKGKLSILYSVNQTVGEKMGEGCQTVHNFFQNRVVEKKIVKNIKSPFPTI